MTILTLDQKEDTARGITSIIAEYQNTDVTQSDLDGWDADGVYEWIEAWGYAWEDGEWAKI